MKNGINKSQKYNIAMCCDFFYPRIGGVEMHIFQLALKLIELGHKVIIITHQYDNRQGVRYVTNGLKVYYCPMKVMVDGVIFPSQIGFLPLLRQILIRENIQIVHSHAATSIIGQESLVHAKTLGLKAVFTDHSLFGFGDVASIHVNKLIKFFFSDLDHAISVSHTSKENLTLRAALNPHKISVIPNAVDCQRFKPDSSKRFPKNTFNIVSIGRQCYRKGTDLLLDIIPVICKQYDDVHFIIGGDGQKFNLLQKMVKKYKLESQVELLGSLPHKSVRDVLVRGHLFLNTSITEAFCIANVEAASSGLMVVSTNVGGIPEVLPPQMVFLADPNPKSMIENIQKAIPIVKNTKDETLKQFQVQLNDIYSWMNVAIRTEKIYDNIMTFPQLTVLQRIKRYMSAGPFAGIILLSIIIFDYLLLAILQFFQPDQDIEKAIDVPYQQFQQNKDNYQGLDDIIIEDLQKQKKEQIINNNINSNQQQKGNKQTLNLDFHNKNLQNDTNIKKKQLNKQKQVNKKDKTQV